MLPCLETVMVKVTKYAQQKEHGKVYSLSVSIWFITFWSPWSDFLKDWTQRVYITLPLMAKMFENFFKLGYEI